MKFGASGQSYASFHLTFSLTLSALTSSWRTQFWYARFGCLVCDYWCPLPHLRIFDSSQTQSEVWYSVPPPHPSFPCPCPGDRLLAQFPSRYLYLSLFFLISLTRLGWINLCMMTGGIWLFVSTWNPWLNLFTYNRVLLWVLVIFQRMLSGVCDQVHCSLSPSSYANCPQISFSCVIAFVLFVMFPCSSLITKVNNSVDRKYAGEINGIAQTLVALSRAVGPLAISPLFSWSSSNGIDHGVPYT